MPKGHYDRTGIDFSPKRLPKFKQLIVKEIGWMDEAACLGMDPDLFFPGNGAHGKDVEAAKAVCMECPVREPCLDFALRNFEKIGIWGGTSERQRARIRKERKIVDNRLYIVD